MEHREQINTRINFIRNERNEHGKVDDFRQKVMELEARLKINEERYGKRKKIYEHAYVN